MPTMSPSNDVRPGQGANYLSATGTPGSIQFYRAGPRVSPTQAQHSAGEESEAETQAIESDPEFYRRVLSRIRSTGELVPLDDVLAMLQERTR